MKNHTNNKGAEHRYSSARLVMDGVYMALLIIMGMIKLPSVIPGAEFQLSAPYAVCLAATVGFKRYLCIGICSSAIQMMLGTHTIWNVVIAMTFRIAAGLIVCVLPSKRLAVAIAGPIGTCMARVVLAFMQHIPALPLIIAAIPGMVFTAVCASIMEPVFGRIVRRSERVCG